ncbi:collagen-like protein [Solirubrobacter phytolaccae]|uniref:Collagen-like protein n=1 Tax=Solirubrobacter phytolaccae TaxID=1404360 RepID=A0A9X3SG74_9ACTN|nr:hypothetical protein [Solirubrobacter phytolaccae]MDA0182132.1 collagen-like protein [Solirubrobacter phytolaccae]
MLRRLSSAHVISMIALFVALGGGAYAASLPRNSVGTAQLRNNVVTSAKVKDGSLKRGDFATGEIPSVRGTVRTEPGPAGATGPAGPQGERGPAGRDGAAAAKGDTGAAGPQGVKGDTGEVGAKGATGSAGPKGDTGAQGPQGLKGDTGAAGAKGDTGAAGKDGATGATGAAGANGIGLAGFFGTGADGDELVPANGSLPRDMYYEDLTVGQGVQINANGYRIFVSGTLVLNQGSRIHRNGNPGNANFPGGALPARTLGAGSQGFGGSPVACNAGSAFQNALGGAGGLGNCGGGGTVARPADEVGGPQIINSATAAITGRTLDGAVFNGGAGGRGNTTTTTGAGGGGGGVVVVVAREIVVNGNATISANGGAAGSSGAGGGGGGVAIVVSTTPKPAGLTLSATGGTSPLAAFNGSDGTVRYFN